MLEMVNFNVMSGFQRRVSGWIGWNQMATENMIEMMKKMSLINER